MEWRLRYPDSDYSKWFADKEEADALLAQWQTRTGATLDEATGRARQAREEFVAEVELEIVTVHNPNPFQVDYQKPTLTFPDGSVMQFEDGVPREQIQREIDAASLVAHPDPVTEELSAGRPELERRQVWRLELLTGEKRRPYPDVTSWDHSFPMADVIGTLDELSREGWTVLNASEDRGLYSSDLAELRVRYLLARDMG
jgi:hypothetical protein